ncbi:hypothetical protein N802_11590 [Knoellia sinensis KCTC 19936]|uniref:Uncharacterized protein n=1 Tax=Knoellia sinensis KCTC 19936 TaxID=1385520 RepID=A0A0A0IWY5_9MICO|nr:hypothetical protein N802_11590 [Knoellia sinensis KCTC 19936]
MFGLNWLDGLLFLFIVAAFVLLARQVVVFLRRKMRTPSAEWDQRMLNREQ